MAEVARIRRKKLVEKDVLEQAAQIFARKGFAGTSLQEVADALGVSRASLYYYFKDKDSLLRALVEDVTLIAAGEVSEIGKQSFDTAAEGLETLVRRRAQSLLDRQHRFRLLVTSEAELRGEAAELHEKSRRSVLKAHTDMIERGIETGEFLVGDPRIAALGIIGMVNWSAWWYLPGGKYGVERIAEQMGQMAVASVRNPNSQATGAPSVKTTIAAIETDLEQLKKLLGG